MLGEFWRLAEKKHKTFRLFSENIFQLTFQCFLYQWPPASRAEDNQWVKKRCPPGWGCQSLQSYCQFQEDNMNLYLKHKDNKFDNDLFNIQNIKNLKMRKQTKKSLQPDHLSFTTFSFFSFCYIHLTSS